MYNIYDLPRLSSNVSRSWSRSPRKVKSAFSVSPCFLWRHLISSLGATEQLTPKVDFFRRSTRRDHFHFGLVSVQLHLGMVGSGRKKNRLCFNTPGSRPSHGGADPPCTILGVSHILEAFLDDPFAFLLVVGGTSIVS
jgi:hypothetical protein